MTSTLKSVAIIGAGVVGVATAYALARRGLDVTVIDGRESAGRGASYANGAQLSYLYTDALANPRLFRDMPALLLGRSEAFRMRLSLDPDYLRWLLAFLRNCTAGRFKRNTLAAWNSAWSPGCRWPACWPLTILISVMRCAARCTSITPKPPLPRRGA